MSEENRILILDASNLLPVLNRNINELLIELSTHHGIDNFTFKAINMLKKTILNRSFCKLIESFNDQPVDALLPQHNVVDDVDLNDMGPYYNNIYEAVYSLYQDTFRFNGNVEINIDCSLSGSNLIIQVYTKGLD